jgi:hypothetical protein
LGAVPWLLVAAIQARSTSLDDPDTTVALLKAGAVVGVRAFTDDRDRISSIGVTCALCHSTVDDSFMKGIGRRLDGWPNRDLDIGKIVATAPTLKPFADMLGIDEDEVRRVLTSWGPGRYDAQLNHDGKAFQADGRSSAVLIPAAFGLAGQASHSYTGWGAGLPYWNAYVANTQMYGKGTFIDRRIGGAQFPVADRTGLSNKRDEQDLITAKLPALHAYQIAIPAPVPPAGSYDAAAAQRGAVLFNGEAKCNTCHVPPLYSEPGFAMHTADEIGIDDFHASRSPTGMYRTTSLKGLFARAKGGFYHDGRFPTYEAVVEHYERHLRLNLSSTERADLVEFLKSL